MSSYEQRAAALMQRSFVPRFTGRIVDWARRWIKLRSEESGDFPGDYDPDLNPLPTALFDFYESGDYDEVVALKSSQSGWTLACFIFICWFITFVRRNFIYSIDSEEEVKVIGSVRLKPMIEDCEPAAARVRVEKSPLAGVVLKFAGLVGYLTGGKSLGKVSNKSAGLVIIDESAALEKAVNKATVKANIKELRARLKKQSVGFLIHISKAGEWEGEVNQEYLRGTRHRCFVPCPHCTEKNGGEASGYQVVEFERIKFGHCKNEQGHYDLERVLRETFLECEHCGQAITEDWKPWMVERRQNRQTYFGGEPGYPLEPRRASFLHDDLLSTFPTLTWGKLAVKYVGVLGDAEGLKNFFKDHCARPEKKTVVEVDENVIYKMVAGYKRGELPVPVRKVLMGVDHQQSGGTWPWVKCGFTWEGDCYVSDWGIQLNEATLLDVANEKVRIKKWPESVPVEQRVDPVVFKGFADERHDQKRVRDFIISTLTGVALDGTPDYRFHACYGLPRHISRTLKDIVSPGPVAKPNAYHAGMPMWHYAISTDDFNREIYTHRYGRWRQVEKAQNAGQPVPAGIRRIFFPECILGRQKGDEQKFVKQVTRETFWFNPEKQRWEWKDVTDNDWGDGLRMCFALWYLLAQCEQAPPPVGPGESVEGDGGGDAERGEWETGRGEGAGREYVLKR
jgi:hypothetical protein